MLMSWPRMIQSLLRFFERSSRPTNSSVVAIYKVQRKKKKKIVPLKKTVRSGVFKKKKTSVYKKTHLLIPDFGDNSLYDRAGNNSRSFGTSVERTFTQLTGKISGTNSSVKIQLSQGYQGNQVKYSTACSKPQQHIQGQPSWSPTLKQSKGVVFYHYTDKKSAYKILMSGKIWASRDLAADAMFGEGVYASPFGPEKGKEFNAINNYGQSLWQQKKHEGKLDCVVRIEMIYENIEEIETDDKRAIIMYKNEDLDLQGPNVYSVEFFGPEGTIVYRKR